MAQLKRYPFLSVGAGVDWQHVDPALLERLNALGRSRKKIITLTSGARAEGHPGDGPHAGPGGTQTQWYLWEHASELGLVRGKTVAKPGTSNHQPDANGIAHAVDASIGGVPLGRALPARDLAAVGLRTLKGDDPHTELAGSGATDQDQTLSTQADAASPTNDSADLPTVTPPAQVPVTGTMAPAPVQVPVAGSHDYMLEPRSPYETWRSLAQLSDLSPDTQRMLQIAGGFGAG